MLLGGMAVFGLTTPAHASGDLEFTTSTFFCSELYAGDRGGSWVVVSHLDLPGVITAISMTPAGAWVAGSQVGDVVRGNKTAWVQFGTGPGPTNASLLLSVHWDTPNGPLNETVHNTIQLNPCMPKPAATLTGPCGGAVTVHLSNGTTSGQDAGGTAWFEVTGSSGFSSKVGVTPGRPTSVIVPAANSDHVVVTSAGRVIAEGGNQSAPGCQPAAGSPPPPPGSRSGAAGGSGQGSGGMAVTAGPAGESASPAAADGSPDQSTTPSGTPAAASGTAAARSATPAAQGASVPVYLATAAAVLLMIGGAYLLVQILRRRARPAEPQPSEPPPAEPST
jgi:hypothetical protein